MSDSTNTNIKCGSNKFCIGFEPDNKVYCYGSSGACLWGQGDCVTDQDCKNKYSSTSPKYTDGTVLSCSNKFSPQDWRIPDACPDIFLNSPTPTTTPNSTFLIVSSVVGFILFFLILFFVYYYYYYFR